MSITAKDLAIKLGLSTAAVSMALNGKPGVSEATRERVLQAAREAGYTFSRGRTRDPGHKGGITLLFYKRHGAVVSDTPFFNSLSGAVADACQVRGYTLNIQYLYQQDLRQFLRSLQYTDTRGVILLGTELRREEFEPFSSFPLPMVVLDTYFEGINRDCVLINNIQGAFLATNHIIAKRNQQPGYLRSSYPIGNFEERADGFYKAIRYNGMATGSSVIHRLAPSVEGAYTDMKALIRQGEPLAKCYFADNDLIAAGAIRALREAGYRIPEDIGIVGFDNIPMCEICDPPMTTIHVPKQTMGQVAVSRLLELIQQGPGDTVKIQVNTTLIQRGSL